MNAPRFVTYESALFPESLHKHYANLTFFRLWRREDGFENVARTLTISKGPVCRLYGCINDGFHKRMSDAFFKSHSARSVDYINSSKSFMNVELSESKSFKSRLTVGVA